jgi:signal transduction histidine kinase
MKRHLGIISIICWTVFTVTLVAWWIYFGMSQLERLGAVDSIEARNVLAFQRMLFWEGLVMITSLVGAGGALLYFLQKEIAEKRRLKEFFAAFTHEIKTPLAGARLKLEVLEEKLEKGVEKERLLAAFKKVYFDIDRLALQIENSLFLADESTRTPIPEALSLKTEAETVAKYFPSLQISILNDIVITLDKRILHSILTNVFQNASVHGKASEIKIDTSQKNSRVVILFQDNGTGFTGDRKKLSFLFERHYQGSGSGVGLYLIKNLIERMNGSITFPPVSYGFLVEVEVPCH